jgi:carbamoyltransferase
MNGYLLLSVTPARRSLLRPFSLFDLGHVDIILCSPPVHPKSYGFYVSPTRPWRVFASVFLPQAARVVRSSAFPEKPTHWRSWRLPPDRMAALREYLEEIEAGCADGSTRYRAVRFNCFHLARRCLEIGGVAAAAPRQWFLGIPTLGSSSFLRGPLAGIGSAPMGRELLQIEGLPRSGSRQGRQRLPVMAFYGIPDPRGLPPGDLHDHNLALIHDGRVLQFLELERVTRRKHDNDLPSHLEELLTRGLFEIPDRFHCVLVDSFAGRRFLSAAGRVRVEAGEADGELAPTIEPAFGSFAGREASFWVCNHELAHLGSLLPFTGGFEEGQLLVHVDGGASRSNASVWLWREGRLQLLYATWDLQSHTRNFNLNPLSAALLGLPRGSNLGVAGRLMGYAAYGQPRPELLEWLRRYEWFHRDGDGLPEFRRAAACDHGWRNGAFDPRDPFLMDVAACMQSDLLSAIEGLIYRFQERTGAESLGFTGGAALNIELNRRLEGSGRFRLVQVPPCCNDSGLALGAAALFEFLHGGSFALHGPFLNGAGLPPYRCAPRFSIAELAARLARGEVVGLCTGAAEAGPRALGHRSLLASPCRIEIRDRVSRTMKRREWYRPVAPIILRADAEGVFQGAVASPLARFMLGSYRVRPEMRDRVPGVVHADGTARVQVVDESDPDLQLVAALLAALRDQYGIPCLINTSFNRPGEPIVHTQDQALEAAWEMGVDALVLDNELVPNPSPRRQLE